MFYLVHEPDFKVEKIVKEMKDCLKRIVGLLQNHPGDSAQWMLDLSQLYDTDKDLFYKQVNSSRMWGGAGSIANQALSDNPGVDDWLWKMQIREFRELMIELAEHLQSRGSCYPDISTWIMAFNNWNQSDI